MKPKWLMLFLLVLLASLSLAACTDSDPLDNGDNNDDDNEDVIEFTMTDLSNSLRNLGNNYQLDITIKVYNEIEANIVIKVNDSITNYIESEYVEFFYHRDGRDLTIYEKQDDTFIKSDEREAKDRQYDFFRSINYEWFGVEENKFILKTNNINDLLNVFNLDESITLTSASIELTNDKVLKSLNILFEEERDPYQLIIVVTKIGTTSITLPEVD